LRQAPIGQLRGDRALTVGPPIPGDAPTEQELQRWAGDWLFHVRTTSCHGDVFDNGTSTRTSRLILPLLCLVCATAVLAGQSHKAVEAERPGPAEPVSAAGRLWHVDFARICAVMCVIFEHCGGETYTHRNVGFGLWWALPYLYITSGMSSMMSKSTFGAYVGRLLAVFCVGTGANLIADISNRRDWRHDMGNTIFQMFFVVMLLLMAPLAEPLRRALREEKGARPFFACGFWGVGSLVALLLFVRGYTGDEGSPVTPEVSRWLEMYLPVLRHAPIIVVHVGGSLFLALLATLVCAPHYRGWVGWILLFFSYAQMVLIPWDQDSFAHLISLNVVGMVALAWPLKGSAEIALYVKAYWPFLLMFLCLDSMPDMWGRCDVHSPYSTWERFRMFLGEFVLVACFLAGAFTPSDPKQITSWLGLWSLYAYCFHVMWYRLLGSPYGAIVTFAGIPIFWALSAYSTKTPSERPQEPEGPDPHRTENDKSTSAPSAARP